MGKGGKWGPVYEPPQVVRAGPAAAVRGGKRMRNHVLTMSPAEGLEGPAFHSASRLLIRECGGW